MIRMKGRLIRLALVVSLGVPLSLTTACGGDDEGQAKPAKKAGKKKRRKKAKKKAATLQSVAKVDDALRHAFTERDFQTDPSGEKNRDPFRSFLISQVLSEGDEGSSGDVTEICPPERSIAVKYSLRSLNLIGIVLRGTRSYALFRDSARFGHIVRRGDCLGKEKAVVNEIGVGYVSLEVTPEAPQGTAAPPAQKRTIALYPEELSVEDVAPSPEAATGDEPMPE